MGRGWCQLHFNRWRRTGSLADPFGPAEDRFWPKVDRRGPDECWPWLASSTESGYGTFRWNKTSGPAHRFSYELVNGPIPEGLEIDHLCRNKPCVNPAHLEAVTHSENNRRKYGDRCRRGHEYTPENTYIHPKRGSRSCKECQRVRDREYRASKRGLGQQAE